MKQIHKFMRLTMVSLLLAGLLVALGVAPSQDTIKVSALSAQECKDRFDGKGSYPGVPDEDKLNWDRYQNSKCDVNDAGTCYVNSSSQGGIVSCYRSKKASCYALFNGKTSPGDLDTSSYDKSKCDESKGGPCTSNGSSQGYQVHCPGDTDDDGNNDNNNGPTNTPGGTYNSRDCINGLEGECKLVDLIVTITNVLSGLAATVIVAMIVWGGIQYSMAGADASKVQAAKQKIMNALIALLLLVFGFSIIQWLVPGGLI